MKPILLAVLLLENEGIDYEIKFGAEALRLTKGKIHPNDGVVVPIHYPNYVLRDVYDAVHFINEHGLKRC